MNTITLQKKYPKTYKDFFQKCQVAASAPHSFMWTGDFSGFFGGLTISSKIPLRFYVGLEKIDSDNFEMESRAIPAYADKKSGFTTISLDNYLVQELTKIGRQDFKGWRAHMLTEVALGKSLGGLGALSACLAKLADVISHPELGSGSHEIPAGVYPASDSRLRGNDDGGAGMTTRKGSLPCRQAGLDGVYPERSRGSRDDNPNQIAGNAMGYLKKLQLGRTSGASAYCALIPSKYPIVYYQLGSRRLAKPLSRIQKLPNEPAWPIDFGLIFSSTLVQGRAIIASADELKKISLERQSQIKELINLPVATFWDDYLAMLQQISCHCLLQLSDVLKSSNDAALRDLFDSLNQYQNLLHFLNISTPEIDKIYSAIHRIANKIENMIGSGCKITGVGKGGEVLFAVPFGKYRQQIADFVGDAGYCLDYASWQDGIESDGVKIEQDLNTQRISSLSGNDSVILKIYSPDLAESRLICPDEISKHKTDLILDTVNNKIYIKGKVATSKEMPSQKTALLLVRKLIDSPSRAIKNTDLPLSYAENRYDLQSKITIPLEKLTDIKFDITGTTYGAYKIALRPFRIKIGIISNI